jgi:exonuclease III
VKLDQLRTILQIENQFDIICVSETWLSDQVSDDDIQLENYDVHRRDRQSRGGGVCIYANSSLSCKRRDDLENPDLELLWLEIKLAPKSIMVGVCYRPPGMTRKQSTKFIEDLQGSMSLVMALEADSTYLLGDFNDRCTQWTGRHPNSELKEDLVDMTTSFGLHQLINEPTHHTDTSANILDLIFTDSPGYVTESGILPPLGTSKHAVVYCKSTKTRRNEKPYTKGIWKYQEADVDGLNIALGDFPFDEVLGEYGDVNHLAEIWTHLVLSITKEYVPYHTIKVKPRDKPWINKDIRDAK